MHSREASRSEHDRHDRVLVARFAAGDAYAAGFLYAFTQGADLKTAGKLGGAMAAQVISQYGPRAEKAEILKLKASVI